MKITCKSINGDLTNVDINPNDQVSTLRDILVAQNKVTDDKILRFIYKATEMKYTEPFSKYNIAENSQIVYMISKMKNPEPVAAPVAPVQAPVAPVAAPVPAPVPAPVQAPTSQLPDTFHGFNVEMIKQMSIPIVLNQVLSDKTLFLEILKKDPQVAILRDKDPAGFDALIMHPQFLQSNIHLSPAPDDEDDEGQFDESGTTPNAGANVLSSLGLTPADQQSIKDICIQLASMGVNTSAQEVVGVYVACDKNKEQTIAILMDQFLG